jgi:hypothetical protein
MAITHRRIKLSFDYLNVKDPGYFQEPIQEPRAATTSAMVGMRHHRQAEPAGRLGLL